MKMNEVRSTLCNKNSREDNVLVCLVRSVYVAHNDNVMALSCTEKEELI
jgi:hypothetical protein